MKHLSKLHLKERDEHQKATENAWEGLDAAVEAFNTAKAEAWAKVEAAKDVYREKIEAANEWRSGLHSDADAYLDDRSEKWKEGDAGQAYSSWVDALDIEIEDASDEIGEPDDIDTIEDASDTIGEIPESPEG